MLTINTMSGDPTISYSTVEFKYEPEQGGKRLLTVPASVDQITSLLPEVAAFKRGDSEVKNGRRRVLLEDATAVRDVDEDTGAPIGEPKLIKIHTVYELPWTGSINSSSTTDVIRRRALSTLTRLHVASLMPTFNGVGATEEDTQLFGTEVAMGATTASSNSPIMRAMAGLAPYGDGQVLGAVVEVV